MWIKTSVKNKMGNELNIGEYMEKNSKNLRKKPLSYFILFEPWLFFNASST